MRGVLIGIGVALLVGAVGGCVKKSPAPVASPAALETYSIQSVPQGASVTLSNGATCQTPCELHLSPTQSLSVKIEKKGFKPFEGSIISHAEVVPDGGELRVSKPRLIPNPLKATLAPASRRT